MRKKYLAVLIKIFFGTAAILMSCGGARAQNLKYVTFFPIPFGSHSDIFVRNKAILGAGHNAEIIFKDNINLSSKQDGSDLDLKELWLSPTDEDNHDVPIAALGDVYAAKISSQDGSPVFDEAGDSYFKLSGNSGKGIINFDNSAFGFTSDSTIDYTIHSGKLSMGEKNSYQSPLYFHNANNGAIGKIDTSGCKRFCWAQLKLPREEEFRLYLICHNNDICPETGYKPVNQTEPKYYSFYSMVDGGKGFFVEGEFEGVKLPFAFSTASMGEINNVDASYHLNLTPAVTYYYSEDSDWELPELTIKAPQNLLATVIPYSLLVPLGLGFELSSDITITLPAPPISDNPSNGVVQIDRPPDCPAGASGETICLKAQAKNYRCVRKKQPLNPFTFSIDYQVKAMEVKSLVSHAAEEGEGEITMRHRKRWPFQWTNEIISVDFCSEIPETLLLHDLWAGMCAASEVTYIANPEKYAHFCCPSLSGTQGECALDLRVPPIPSSYVINPDNWLCKSTYTNGCKCDYLVKDKGGWMVNKYEDRYFFFRLKYYTPQWDNVGTMIECQNTEYIEDGLY